MLLILPLKSTQTLNDWYCETEGAFDLLKNKGQDKTTQVVQCLIYKCFRYSTNWRQRTYIFVPHETTTQLFVPCTSCLKYQNNISSLKNRIKQKIIQCYKNLSCVVLPCVVLFSLVLSVQYLLFCKPNTPERSNWNIVKFRIGGNHDHALAKMNGG